MPSGLETLALLFAGLGFFFIGLGGLKNHLQQMAQRNFRRMLARWLRIPGLSALAGVLFGAITQSATAVAFIMSGFVSGGLIRLNRALPVVGWAHIGTTLLVFVAAFDIKIAALYMIGVSAIAVTFNIGGRYKAFLNALYSVGLLFFGLRTMREAFTYLPEFDWFPPSSDSYKTPGSRPSSAVQCCAFSCSLRRRSLCSPSPSPSAASSPSLRRC